MDIATRFGKNLARERKRADLSQEELGVRASLHRTEISQLERGLRCPKADTIVKLAGSLEVEPAIFFEGMVWEPGGIVYGHFKPDQDATL